jgi:Na+-transporting NADH:ubiquinone oxidoreductase subunit B
MGIVTSNNRHFVIATIPAAVIGVWNLGMQIENLPAEAAGAWQLAAARALAAGIEAPGNVAAIAVGAAAWLPLLGIALLVSFFWASLFSRVRARSLDAGWLLHAWLFSLLLPPAMPPGFAAIALSFGLVFGCHVFGGTGKYLVNPALLAVVFLTFAYPSMLDMSISTWSIVAAGGIEAAATAGTTLLDAFAGREAGAIGATSVIASVVGALYLVATRSVSPSIIVAGLFALAVSGASFGALPWAWHLALGNFAFVLIFLATDPTPQPRTTVGKIVFGGLFGLLTVVVRTADPSHPEGTWAALLFACLIVPLIDYLTQRTHREPTPQPLNQAGAIE